MAPLFRFTRRLRLSAYGTPREVVPSRPIRKPYFHSVPLFWAAAGALAGSTLASSAAGVASAALGIGLVLLEARPARSGTGGGGLSQWGLSTGCVRRPRRVGPIAIALFVFAAGSARGLVWRGQEEWAGRLASAGPCQAVFLPLDAASDQGAEAASFRARLYSVDPLSAGGSAGKVPGRLVEVTIFARDVAKVKPGVPLKATGRFALPAQGLNPGEFDRRRHLSSERTFVEFECSRVEVGVWEGAPELAGVYPRLNGAVRSYAGQAIDSALPQEEGAVLKGVLLADRKGLPLEVTADFKRSGFYRFATIAGFHVDVVFALSEGAVRRATKKPWLSRSVAGGLTFVYAGLSGWTPGAIRAFTCASMRAAAPHARRKYDPLAGLATSALVVSWMAPFPLGDAGFQLSFAGALGSYLAGRYAPLLRLRSRAVPAGAFRVAGIFLLLLPITAASFQDVSVAGFVAGGLWAGAIAFLIPASVLTVLLPGAGQIVGWFPYVIVKGLRQATSWIASIPAASLAVPAPGKIEAIVYYLLILILARWGEEGLRRRATGGPVDDLGTAPIHLRPVAVLVCCATLLVLAVFRVYLPWPDVAFISVGQGDCALVRYRDAAILVDTGTSGGFQSKALPYLRRLGVTRIDLCVLSHLHEDHAGGLALLCQEFRVFSVMTAEGTAGGVRALLPPLASVTPGRPLPQVFEAGPGSSFSIGGLVAKAVCVPAALPSAEAANDQSLALVLSGPRGFFLEFWGDAPSQSVSENLLAYPGDLCTRDGVRVAKVPHHGSRDSLAPGFYERLSSGFAIVSVGPNSYGHPSNEVLQAAASCGASLFRTDRNGAVFVRYILGRVWVKPFLGG